MSSRGYYEVEIKPYLDEETKQKYLKHWEEHPMRKPRVEAVIINCSVGKSGEPLERARTILEELTGATPKKGIAKKTIRDFGIRKKEPISLVITLRKQKAIEFLKRVMEVKDNMIDYRNFDNMGNFAFGIREHIDIPGTKYNPDLGIIGFNVVVKIARPGTRIKRRRLRRVRKIPQRHKLSTEESMVFVEEELGIKVVEIYE